ncbi:MAG: ATPase, T2SS/T4P/T4SS family [Rickettsiales bacterium]|nr:ATPase, T2SS/T4P/T4SS family [Rickettsiales bacterium]MDG4546340.1 ATPase, T2SS/T4P/T4SS family [Rickettsiales bacterium]MDG4548483.1 ATPase, T2SS/T4P/T4SS family [Rickettsiales bacterium]
MTDLNQGASSVPAGGNPPRTHAGINPDRMKTEPKNISTNIAAGNPNPKLQQKQNTLGQVPVSKGSGGNISENKAQSSTVPPAPISSGSKVPPMPVATKDSEGKEGEPVKNVPLGEKLLNKGLISKDQLETALTEQKNQPKGKKKMLGAVLIDMGFITESTLGEVLTESSGVKIFDIKKTVLDPNLIQKVPKDVAMRSKAVPVAMEDGAVRVAITDIYNILAIDQIRKYFPRTLKIVPVYAPESDLLEIIDQYYGYETSISGILREIETGISDKDKQINGEMDGYINPTVRLVDAILVDAIKRGASDIHLEPEGNFVRLRYRIDGKLIQVRSFHKDYWPAVVVRIKIMSGMNIAETRNPQDGRTSYFVLGRDIDFRVATHPTVFGENIVLRILDKRKSLVPLEQLGLSEKNEILLRKLLKRPEGIIIVTGPTGSGKTTTLYSILNLINEVDVNIMTLENPVEYQLSMIRQSDIKEDKGMDFVDGIKSLMRQDPDIIFVGEVRDEATASMAIRAAMTGHKVFTTLHTNDAVGAIPRLVDIGIPPHLLGGSLICVIAQRLLRKLCLNCRQADHITEEESKIYRVDPSRKIRIFRRKGCEECMHTGYKGRIAVHEIFPCDKGLDELISTGASRRTMVQYAAEKGFVPMVNDGIKKALAGITDLDELIRTVDMTERL